MKKGIVRKGYVVFWKSQKFREGTEVPSPILKDIIDKQSWKIDIVEEKENGSKKTEEDKKERKEGKIEEISANRMVADSLVRKRG